MRQKLEKYWVVQMCIRLDTWKVRSKVLEQGTYNKHIFSHFYELSPPSNTTRYCKRELEGWQGSELKNSDLGFYLVITYVYYEDLVIAFHNFAHDNAFIRSTCFIFFPVSKNIWLSLSLFYPIFSFYSLFLLFLKLSLPALQ